MGLGRFDQRAIDLRNHVHRGEGPNTYAEEGAKGVEVALGGGRAAVVREVREGSEKDA